MKKENNLKELHKIELKILEEVDKICKKHNITYYLGEGSLLGAIRHQGFIPWDDDIDILMERSEYEKFLKIAPTTINSKYEIQHSTTLKPYWSPFIKVRLLEKTKFNQEHIKHLTTHNGPLIDIFPIDNVPKKWSFLQKVQGFMVKYYRGMLSYKLGLKKAKRYKSKILKFMSNFYKERTLHKKLDKTFKKYNNESNKYSVNLGSYYSAKKQTFPKSWYGKPRYVKFENMIVPIPKEAEKILKSVYGNYMELPPVEKRVIKHHFE